MRLSMISKIIKDEVCVIRITQTEALIILDIMRKPNSIIVLLCIQNKETNNNTNGEYGHLMPTSINSYNIFFLMFA